MRRRGPFYLAALVVLVLCRGSVQAADKAAAAAGAKSARAAKVQPVSPAAVDDGWPDSREGALGRRWVAAFASGAEAMRAFYANDLAWKSRAEKSVEGRLARYRELRERFGKLTFGSVIKSDPGELTVTLLDADAATHRFVFKAEAEAPYRLISVGMLQRVPGGHGGGSGFHH